jgi:hypothetical protein
MDWLKILKLMLVSTIELMLAPILVFVIIGVLIKLKYFGYNGVWYFAIQLFSWTVYLHIGYLASNKFKIGLGGAAITGALAGVVYGITTYFVPWQVVSLDGIVNNSLMWGTCGLLLGTAGGEISSQRNLLIAMAALIILVSFLFRLSIP